MYCECSFILSFRILFIPTWHTPKEPSWGFRTAHDTSRILQPTKSETREDQALIPTTIPWDGNHSFRPLQTDTRLYLTLLHVGAAALQLIRSLVLHHHQESHQLHLQASARHPVLSQLVPAHTRLGSSSQLCQAHCGQLVFERPSCVPISLAKGLISRLPEEEVGQGELIQCMQMQEEQETQS